MHWKLVNLCCYNFGDCVLDHQLDYNLIIVDTFMLYLLIWLWIWKWSQLLPSCCRPVRSVDVGSEVFGTDTCICHGDRSGCWRWFGRPGTTNRQLGPGGSGRRKARKKFRPSSLTFAVALNNGSAAPDGHSGRTVGRILSQRMCHGVTGYGGYACLGVRQCSNAKCGAKWSAALPRGSLVS